MFFVLSKTVSFLLMPLTIICVCFIAVFFIRNAKWKKRMFGTGLILLLFFSNEFIANEAMRAWEVRATAFQDMRPYQWGVVLTGTTIPLLQPDDRIYFQRGADRVAHTVQLYRLGLIRKILVSGGGVLINDSSWREADELKEVMVMMGLPPDSIVAESGSRNTHESAVAVRKALDSMDVADKDCLLITSAFHMRRAAACFRKQGLNMTSFTTDFYSRPRFINPDVLLVPKVEAIVIWHKLAKEWVGLVAYEFAGYV